MIRVIVCYPNEGEGKRFDHDYYKGVHLPIVKEKFKPFGLVSIEIDKGMLGVNASPTPFVAVGHLIFETLEGFHQAFAMEGDSVLADVTNFTDASPVVQISEMVPLN